MWVAVAGPVIGPHAQAVYAEGGYQFEGDRDAVRKATVDAAFEMLLRVLAPGLSRWEHERRGWRYNTGWSTNERGKR